MLLPLAFAVLILVFPVLSDDLYYQNMIILSLVFAIGAVGLNIISGYGGYISLGQSAFIGIGAYTIGLGALKVGGSPWIWVPIAGVVGGLFAMVMGLIAMRTRGHSFVILTIAFLFLLQLVAINWDELTNGTQGLSLPIPMWDVAYQYWPFYYSLIGVLVLAVLRELADPQHEVRHGPHRDARGRGQGRDDRRQHAGLQDARLRRVGRLRSAWPARSTPTTWRSSTRAACSRSS